MNPETFANAVLAIVESENDQIKDEATKKMIKDHWEKIGQKIIELVSSATITASDSQGGNVTFTSIK